MWSLLMKLMKMLQSDGSAGFLRAARSGHLERVLEFLKNNTDINTCNANGLNALHLAAKEGHVHIVRELVNRGANVDAATKKGNTALHIASLAGQEEVVKLLVQNNALVNMQSQNGFTPLYMAAQENHDNVVKYLLSSGANQSLATEDGFTPLAVALQQGHDKVVAVLLENDTKGKVRLPALHIAAKKDDTKAAALLLQNEHNPDVTSKSGFTPLHIAAHYGNENIAALLLQRGADVNFAAKHNITPLHVAAKWGKGNMVATLIEKGGNIEAKTRDGLSPLHCAARSGHDTVVDMLLEKGAPLTAKTKNGLAPLHMASQGDHVDSARILLSHKAPVDDVTVDYLTALHVAAHCGHVRVAKLLLDRKADPNARALNGFTPLHIACKKNRMKVVELLLKHGGSIEATTESGLTPLHVASFMGCMNIVIYLIQHSSNPDTPTVRGETPLHLAARANQTDIIRILLRNGAQVDARAREQQTPLHIASRLGNVDIVVLLLQHGASVDATTKDLYTALHIAAKEGQEEVAQVLVEHGASLFATTKKGFTPLHLAAKYGNMKVARLLLQRDAPVDAEGRNGVTPLHVAAHYDHQNVALLLLDKGASPHAAAKNGYTPLHIAAKKNQMDIATTLLEYGANTNAESKAGFTPLHLSAQEGHTDMCSLLLEHQAKANHQAKNGLTPLHLCAQEDRVNAAAVLLKADADKDATTKAGYTPLHVACHFGQMNMVRFLLKHESDVNANTRLGYTPLHQAAQQGHTQIVTVLLDHNASPNAVTSQGQTALSIAQRLGYISVVETLKIVTETIVTTTTTTITEEKYRVLAPETMHETFLSDSEDEGGEDFLDSGPSHVQHVYLPYYEGQMLLTSDDNMLGDASYRYLTVDEMKSLGDDSLPIDVTKDERVESRIEQSLIGDLGASPTKDDLRDGYPQFTGNYQPDNVDISHTPVYSGFLVSFMVDARGGAMRGCRHSGVRVIIPPRKAPSPMRITCRYLKKEKVVHPPPLMEGEALASRILEMGPGQAKFLGPVIIEVPHFASLRGKEREITILRSDNGETWREHTLEASEEAVQDVLNDSFDGEELNALEDLNTNRITRILTTDFPQYFAIVTRVRQEIHAIGPEGGMVSSTVVPQVQAVFPQGALTKKIKVGLQAQPIQADLVAKLLGNRVAVSPIVTVEPRRRKFHKPITLTIPVPQASSKGMINEYSGDAPTLRLLCSITGGPSRAQWEDVTGSTPLTFVNECVSFTTTVSARFWLIDCRNIVEATKMATELYREAIHVPFMAKFVVFSKRHDVMEASLRVFCMTDDKEDKTLEVQEHFQEVAKSRDVEVLEAKPQYVEFAGNLVPITKSGEQLKLSFFAFRENRLPFKVRIRDPNSEPVGRIAFMKEPKVGRGDPPQTPLCNLNLALPAKIAPESLPSDTHIYDLEKKYGRFTDDSHVELIHKGDLQLSDLCNLLGSDWIYLARQLELPESDIHVIESEYFNDTSKQAQVMIRLWMTRAGNKATGNTLEKALSSIGRDDILKKCLVNVELVTDDVEKAVAETQMDRSAFDDIDASRDASLRRDGSLDVSYDEQDMIKESESVEESSSVSSAADKRSESPKVIRYEEKKDKEKSPSGEKEFVKFQAEEKEQREGEKGAWEEPEKEVEERIVPEKRTSSIITDEEKRPKQQVLEELGKELGRLESSFVPKTSHKEKEDLGRKEVEEMMIIKESKGARSPTTEQIEVFPEQLHESGADTSVTEAACLAESDSWRSDVDKPDSEEGLPASHSLEDYQQKMVVEDSKFRDDDLLALDKMAVVVEPIEEPEFSKDDLEALEMLSEAFDNEIRESNPEVKKEEVILTESSVDGQTGEVIEAPFIATTVDPLLHTQTDSISEALQSLEDLEPRQPFYEKVDYPSEPDDEIRDITKRVADVASSLASTLEKIESDIPEIQDQEPLDKPKKKAKHVTIKEGEEIINEALGDMYDVEMPYEVEDQFDYLTDEDRMKAMQSFQASVDQMLFDVEQESARYEPDIFEPELSYTPELSDDELIRHPSPQDDVSPVRYSPRSPSSGSEGDEARPIKAEIKLLVKTTEPGKEAVEIRSIREFVESDDKDKSKGHFSRIIKSPTPSTEESPSRGSSENNDGAEQNYPVIGEGSYPIHSQAFTTQPDLIIGTPEGESYFNEFKKAQEVPGVAENLAVDIQDLTLESTLLVKDINEQNLLSEIKKEEVELESHPIKDEPSELESEKWDFTCSEEEFKRYEPIAEQLAEKVMSTAFEDIFPHATNNETIDAEPKYQSTEDSEQCSSNKESFKKEESSYDQSPSVSPPNSCRKYDQSPRRLSPIDVSKEWSDDGEVTEYTVSTPTEEAEQLLRIHSSPEFTLDTPPQWHHGYSQSGAEPHDISESPVEKFESSQYTTPEGASVHTTQYTTPDGTTVTTTHTRVVSGDLSSSDSEQISEQHKPEL